MGLCYLNGEYLPPEDARVPVRDRGFMFADGVYEVLPVYDGRPFRLQAHTRRLARSLAAIGMAPVEPEGGWPAVLGHLVEANGGGDQSLYLQVTRGAAPRSHLPPGDAAPTVLAMSEPHRYDTPAGVAAVTRADFRWGRCDIKAIALLASVMLRQDAHAHAAEEAILHRDGALTEAAAANVFAVLAGEVRTPALSPALLAGITREWVLELCAELDLPVNVGPVPVAALPRAEEIWLASSTRELVPVVRLDGRPVGAGAPGPLWQRVYGRYRERVRSAPRYAAGGHD